MSLMVYHTEKEFSGIIRDTQFYNGKARVPKLKAQELIRNESECYCPPLGKKKPEKPDPEEKIELEDFTVSDLRDMCRDLGITGYSNMRKAELIEAIQEE